jgi:outer membrane protein assembly factor BamA
MIQKLTRVLFLMLFAITGVQGQDSASIKPKKEEKSYAAIPMLNYNRTQGFILGALVSRYYKINNKDTISPASNTGIFGMYTGQKSYALMGFTRLYFARDKWRITAAVGIMDINFQFYLEDAAASTGNFYDYTTKANFLVFQVQRNLFNRLYIGPSASFIKSTTTFSFPDATGKDSVNKSNLNNIGYIITNDTRDHVQYPARGMFLNFKNQFYRSWAGSDYEFERYVVTYNQFFNLHKNNDKKIVAIRATMNVAAGDVPFEGQTVVGGDDIRGYSQGQYRDDQVYTLQTEYRWNFYKRWGMVAFAGVASAVEKISDIPDNDLLPGVGVGLRFKMLPAHKINIGIDGAVGKGDWSITFRIGESFAR